MSAGLWLSTCCKSAGRVARARQAAARGGHLVSLVIGMAVLTALGMLVIWAPAYPKPERDPHMRAMDELERRRKEADRD